MMVVEMLSILHSVHMVSSAMTAKCIDIKFRVLIATNLMDHFAILVNGPTLVA